MVLAKSGYTLKTERELAEAVAAFRYDPLGFVRFIFPWGVRDGPLWPPGGKPRRIERWQEVFLVRLGEHLADNGIRREMDCDYKVFRAAVTSGHGVGKTTLIAWLILFFMSTRPECRGVVTANTQSQLELKTWPELGHWHDRALNRHWFARTATQFYFAAYSDESKRKQYMFNAQTVSTETPEGFQGLHNLESAVVMLVDEASGIDEKVMEIIEGAMTDGEGVICKFGNPTRPDGEFFECCEGKYAEMYYHQKVDSRDVSFTNKEAINDIIRKYGDSSDEAKIRVYGHFPAIAFDGFISPALVSECQQREVWRDDNAPLVLGIDVARYGNDRTVLFGRKGRDGRTWPSWDFKGLDSVQVAEKIAEWAMTYKPDAIVVENSANSGSGVIDTLRHWNYKVFEVYPGARSAQPQLYDRLREEWWVAARQWMYDGGCLDPADTELFSELTKLRYKVDHHHGTQLQVEAKAEMKKRIGFSPDRADAFVLTFAQRFVRKNIWNAPQQGLQTRQRAIVDYDVMAL